MLAFKVKTPWEEFIESIKYMPTIVWIIGLIVLVLLIIVLSDTKKKIE